MSAAREPVITQLEQQFAPKHVEHEQRTQELREQLEQFQATLADVETDIEDLALSSAGAFGEQHDVLREAVVAAEQRLQEHLAGLAVQRQQLLVELEQLTIEHLNMYGTPPTTGEAVTTEDFLRHYQRAITDERVKLGSAGWLKRMLSRSHQQAKDAVAGHQRILDLIKSSYAVLTDDAHRSIADHTETAAALVNRLHREVYTQLTEHITTHIETIRAEQLQLYEVAKNPEWRNRMHQRVEQGSIQPTLENLRGTNPTSERLALIAEWGEAVRDLLTHGVNEDIGPTAEESAALTERGEIWPGYRSKPLNIRGVNVTYYGHREQTIRERLAETYPRKPYEQWKYVDPSDDARVKSLDSTVKACDPADRGDSIKFAQGVLRLFADWRAHRRFAREVQPELRPPMRAEDYKQLLANEAMQHLDDHDQLLADLRGLHRWQTMREDPAIAALAEPAEFDDFERFVTNILIDKILRPGGRESWAGTTAAQRIEALNSPQTLPDLLDYVMYSGSGHTSVVVYRIIERIAQSPAGRVYIETLPAVQRSLFEQVIEPNSVLNKDFGGHDDVYVKTAVLGRGEYFLAKAKLADLFSREVRYATGQTERDAFLGDFMTQDDVIRHLGQHRSAVETVVLQQTELAPWWTINKLSELLASDPNFVEQVGRTVNPGDVDYQAQLQAVVTHREFTKSKSTRTAVLQGLLFLRSAGEPGRSAAQDILRRFRGSKDDPKRLRKLFRSLEVLDRFGEVGYNYDETAVVSRITAELAETATAAAQTDDRTEKKRLRTQSDRLERERDYATGLAGPVEHIQGRVGEVLVRKLQLTSEVGQRMAEQFEDHVESGLVDISTTLMLSFQAKKVERPQQTLSQVLSHIVQGDFASWKYNHDYARAQLAFLGNDKTVWQTNEPAVLVAANEAAADTSAARNAAVDRLVADALQHLTEAERTDPDSTALRARLVQMREQLQSGTVVVTDMLSTLQTEQTTALGLGLTQVASDLEQCAKPFLMKELGAVQAEEFDDAVRLLKMGTEPSETCQSWKRGMYNECLLAYVADGDKKGMNVVGETGEVLLRCVERITESRADFSGPLERSLVLEPPYTMTNHPRVFTALARLALNKADRLQARIEFSPGWPDVAISCFASEAQTRGRTLESDVQREVRLSRSMNQYNYSDTFGGKLEPYDGYHQRELTAITAAAA